MDKKDYLLLLNELSKIVKAALSKSPGCHDWDHTQRVLRNSQEICRSEKKADRQVVEIASLLHDIARSGDMKKTGRKCHAQNGAILARKILSKFKFLDEGFIEKVCLCVKRHRYRGEEKPQSIEEKVIYDADKLDSLGAIGIGRAFHFAGRIGARLHNTEDEALSADSYSREDTAYREYLVKMRHLPEKMLTKAGRKIALEREKFMRDFFKKMEKEIKGLC